MKRFVFLIAIIAAISACAPRAVVKPAPGLPQVPENAPLSTVMGLIRQQTEGIKGLKASVKVTVQALGKNPNSFDGVLYVARPDKVRLTGLAFLGVTIFDIVVKDEKFYFYRPEEGYLYTGPETALQGFLLNNGVDIDPEEFLHAILLDNAAGKGAYSIEKTDTGYSVLLGDGVVKPRMKAEYDQSLNLVQKVFYDDHGAPYLFITEEGITMQDGFRLPTLIKARDTKHGYSVTVDVEKYIINPPEGMEGDFTIEGGELKGIRPVE